MRSLASANSTKFSEAVYRELVDASPRPILITNDRLKITYVNKAWERTMGYSFAEVRGKKPRILHSNNAQKGVFIRMWKMLKAGKPYESDDIVDRRKKGRLLNISIAIFPVRVLNKIYYVQILRDITKRKKLQQYQGAFIKVAAHDIRSPLSAIQLMSELLAKKAREQSRGALEKDVRCLQDEVARAGRLVSTLLDISLFESGKIVLRNEEVDVLDLIKQVLVYARTIAPSQKFETRATNINMIADRERICQVLINLVENAIKYGSGRYSIVITVIRRDGKILFSVKDRGPGMSKEVAARIFEPFYRTSYAKKKKIYGHGLGLHIAHKIIQAHHGHIWIEPRNGGGSVFSFTIPEKKVGQGGRHAPVA
jgi:PAS domain S-box-containing protein